MKDLTLIILAIFLISACSEKNQVEKLAVELDSLRIENDSLQHAINETKEELIYNANRIEIGWFLPISDS